MSDNLPPTQQGANLLSDTDRERLVKLLGLLGSDYAGERDAAGLAAMRLLREHGLQWSDIIASPNFAAPRRSELAADWRDDVERCIRGFDLLTEWERGFIISLRGFSWPTPRRAAVLRDIARKVRAAEGRAA